MRHLATDERIVCFDEATADGQPDFLFDDSLFVVFTLQQAKPHRIRVWKRLIVNQPAEKMYMLGWFEGYFELAQFDLGSELEIGHGLPDFVRGGLFWMQ